VFDKNGTNYRDITCKTTYALKTPVDVAADYTYGDAYTTYDDANKLPTCKSNASGLW